MTQAVGEERKAAQFKGSFTSFSVDNIDRAMEFYGDTLGLDVTAKEEGLSITPPGGEAQIFLYPKKDHRPATFTVFNLMVADVARAATDLKERGIKFEQYEGDIETDENGIHWGKESGEGPNIAWFRDPSGNIISIIEEM